MKQIVTATIDELRNVFCLRDLPDSHLQWILDRGNVLEYDDGDLIFKTGDPIDDMIFALEGKTQFYLDVNGKLVYYFSFGNDVETGGVGGLLPYSRMRNSPGFNYSMGKAKFLMLHKKYFQELEQLNPAFIQRLIGYMTDRARHFATQKLQQEKVSALGQLAAGIAHELNNPAAAINRISSELTKRLNQNYDLTQKLLDDAVKPEYISNIKVMMEQKMAPENQEATLSAMARIEREDDITAWLEENSKPDQQVSETFTESGFTVADLENIKDGISGDVLPGVLKWMENLLSARKILKDLDEASSRISNLVGAIKSHVHMDRTSDMQPTNVHKDIDNTLTLLGHKIREKNITINKNYCNNLRDVQAYVGELNQVWTNLLDNAIFAAPKNGEISVITKCNSNEITVKIIDNGAGIPENIVTRIFDPFFTTKKQGEGTGIGLDIVQRIINRHNAEIKVASVPGRTEFTICLPFHKKEKEETA